MKTAKNMVKVSEGLDTSAARVVLHTSAVASVYPVNRRGSRVVAGNTPRAPLSNLGGKTRPCITCRRAFTARASVQALAWTFRRDKYAVKAGPCLFLPVHAGSR